MAPTVDNNQEPRTAQNKTKKKARKPRRKKVKTGIESEIRKRKPTRNYISVQMGEDQRLYNVLVDSGAGVSCVALKVVHSAKLPLLELDPSDDRILSMAMMERSK